LIGDNETTVCKNINLSVPKQFSKRDGFALNNTFSSTATPLGVYRYRTQAGVERFLCALSNGLLYKATGGYTGSTVLKTGYSTSAAVRWEFETFNDEAIMVNGVNQPQTYYTVASGLGGSPPSTGKDVESWLDRLWMIETNTSNLYWTTSKNPRGWNTATQYTPIGFSDGSITSNIKKSGNYLYVWKYPSGLFRVTPANDSSAVSKVTKVFDIGCVGVKSCCKTPQGFIWCDGETVWLWNESDYPTDIGNNIKTTLSGCNFSALTRSVMTYKPDTSEVMFSVPYGGSQTTNNLLLVCSLLDGYRWTKADMSIGDMTVSQINGRDVLFGVDAPATGRLLKLFSGTDDISTAIDAQLASRWFTPRDFGENARSAYLDFIRVVISADGDYNCSIGYDVNFAGSPTWYLINQYSGGLIIGTGIIGVDTIGGGNDIYHEQKFKGADFEHIRIWVKNNKASQVFTIKSIEVGIIPRKI